MPELIHEIEQIVKAQYTELRKALHGEGQFCLTGSMRRFVLSTAVWNEMSEDEKSEHEETFHRRKVTAASSNVQSTVTSSDGKLSVPDVKGIARKPRQQRRTAAERTRSTPRSKRSKVQ